MDRTGTVLLKALRRRPKGEAKGLSHKGAFEDGGEMTVFQQPPSQRTMEVLIGQKKAGRIMGSR